MKHQYSEDLFAETRMSFGEHLDDLRKHLMWALKGFLVCLVISFFFGWYVLDFIKKPVEKALADYHLTDWKQNPEREHPVVRQILEAIDREDADPALEAFKAPKPIPVTIPAGELDRALRQLYPALFQSGPLKDAAPPSDQTPDVGLTMRIRPSEFLRHFQAPLSLVAKRATLTTLSPQESFMVYFKVSILCGFVLGSPWIFFQVWAFVAAGLYPHERRYVYYSLAPSILLFLSGVVLCQFAIIPVALKALLGFNLWLNLEPDLRLNEWLGFAILMPVVTGLCFQTPLAMFVLGKIGMFTAADFAAKRKIAFFVMLILAAFAPAVDIVSLFLLWAPMVALYELGIFLVRYSEKKSRDRDHEEPYVPAGSSGESTSSPP